MGRIWLAIAGLILVVGGVCGFLIFADLYWEVVPSEDLTPGEQQLYRMVYRGEEHLYQSLAAASIAGAVIGGGLVLGGLLKRESSRTIFVKEYAPTATISAVKRIHSQDSVKIETGLLDRKGGFNMSKEKRGGIASAIIWMFIISLLLFWLPLIGPLIAGVVGGKKAGGVGAAIIAVILPAFVIGVILFGLATSLTGMPVIGAIAGSGGFVLSLVHIGPLLVGAIIGGVLA